MLRLVEISLQVAQSSYHLQSTEGFGVAWTHFRDEPLVDFVDKRGRFVVLGPLDEEFGDVEFQAQRVNHPLVVSPTPPLVLLDLVRGSQGIRDHHASTIRAG